MAPDPSDPLLVHRRAPLVLRPFVEHAILVRGEEQESIALFRYDFEVARSLHLAVVVCARKLAEPRGAALYFRGWILSCE